MSDDEHNYVLSLVFDTDDPQFARGFEAGTIWAKLCEYDAPMTLTVGGENAEMFMRMAEAQSRTFSATEIASPAEGDWYDVQFGPKP